MKEEAYTAPRPPSPPSDIHAEGGYRDNMAFLSSSLSLHSLGNKAQFLTQRSPPDRRFRQEEERPETKERLSESEEEEEAEVEEGRPTDRPQAAAGGDSRDERTLRRASGTENADGGRRRAEWSTLTAARWRRQMRREEEGSDSLRLSVLSKERDKKVSIKPCTEIPTLSAEYLGADSS